MQVLQNNFKSPF